MAIEPMEQFLVHKVAPIPPVRVPGLGLVDLSVTNSVLFMLIAAGLISLFFLAAGRRQVVPGRLQAAAEMLYGMIDGVLTGGIIGDRGRPFLPFILTLFLLIATLNVISLAPGGFSVTSQLAVTAALAVMTFTTVLVVGFARNGLRFFKLFWPSSMHPIMAVCLIPIELISFMVRPLTLAMRLFGNMLGGHVVTYMFGSFVVSLGLWGLAGSGLVKLGLLGSGVSFLMIVALTALEFVVAFLQAFVFAALACVYLNEVVNLDHGH
ncbi:MAG TPA: F0F1 ATP synthase subunit A [Caulobacteraceae bacterium]|jgi:F-type H+-transporting ATPase subunit a|nr:F0F1 ATP synthase subunit A [Caulobacteraceae bacterium]